MNLFLQMTQRQTEPVIEMRKPIRLFIAQCRTCHSDVVTSFTFRDIALARMATHAQCHGREVTISSAAGDVLKHYDVREDSDRTVA